MQVVMIVVMNTAAPMSPNKQNREGDEGIRAYRTQNREDCERILAFPADLYRLIISDCDTAGAIFFIFLGSLMVGWIVYGMHYM